MELDIEHTNQTDKLNFDPSVLQSPSILGSNRHGTFHRFPIEVQRCLFPPILVELDINSLTAVGVLQDDIDIDWGGEEERGHCGGEQKTTRVGVSMRLQGIGSLRMDGGCDGSKDAITTGLL